MFKVFFLNRDESSSVPVLLSRFDKVEPAISFATSLHLSILSVAHTISIIDENGNEPLIIKTI